MIKKIKQKWAAFKKAINPLSYVVLRKELNSVTLHQHMNNLEMEYLSRLTLSHKDCIQNCEFKEYQRETILKMGALKRSITKLRTVPDKNKHDTDKELSAIDIKLDALEERFRTLSISVYNKFEKYHSKVSDMIDKYEKIEEKEKTITNMILLADKHMKELLDEQKSMLALFENAMKVQGQAAVFALRDVRKELLDEITEHAIKQRIKDDTSRKRNTTKVKEQLSPLCEEMLKNPHQKRIGSTF